ncbi:Kinase suppressor of Ras 2 [Liparis tanakae]|uniref:Kinase suppressor of Ras 2 n=1 Tax=Liparis tanakae TaxID=230148 RepID=A0A4Z2FVY4_9TELE|nr:Kinase suppressor of Ras 2 [Liparis tanakae]
MCVPYPVDGAQRWAKDERGVEHFHWGTLARSTTKAYVIRHGVQPIGSLCHLVWAESQGQHCKTLMFTCLSPYRLMFTCLSPYKLMFTCLSPYRLMFTCLSPYKLMFTCLSPYRLMLTCLSPYRLMLTCLSPYRLMFTCLSPYRLMFTCLSPYRLMLTAHAFHRERARGKLVKYFSRQLSCKCKVALEERSEELQDFPRLGHWFRIVNLRKEVTQEMSPGQLTLEGLLEQSEEQVRELLHKFGANEEESARLNASLSCLRNAHRLEQLEEDKLHSNGGSQAKLQDWSIQWPTSESGKENTPVGQPEASQWIRYQLSQSPIVQSKYQQHTCRSPGAPPPPLYADRLTVDAPAAGLFPPLDFGHRSLPPSPRQKHYGHTAPRTPLVVNTMTPPGTPPMRRRNRGKAPGTPPPPSRKLIHLLPGFTALHRSKSHEFQLGNRLEDPQTPNLIAGLCGREAITRGHDL